MNGSRVNGRRPNVRHGLGGFLAQGVHDGQEAQKVLWANQSYSSKVKNFATSHTRIRVAADAPGPLIVARNVNEKNVLIHSAFILTDFEHLLTAGQFSMLLLNHPLTGPTFSAIYLGTERLAVNVPHDSAVAQMAELHFKDLTGTTFLVAQNVGFWGRIFERKIPRARFIYQDNSAEYSELLKHSNLPYFSTNLTTIDHLWGNDLPQDRVAVPFVDKVAQQKFYACFLIKNKQRLLPLIDQLQDTWATAD